MILKKNKPEMVFYFAGQSSPSISFVKNKITYLSNVRGCENFLKIISKEKFDTKFINASSSEIFADTKKKISLEAKKKTNKPLRKSKINFF